MHLHGRTLACWIWAHVHGIYDIIIEGNIKINFVWSSDGVVVLEVCSKLCRWMDIDMLMNIWWCSHVRSNLGPPSRYEGTRIRFYRLGGANGFRKWESSAAWRPSGFTLAWGGRMEPEGGSKSVNDVNIYHRPDFELSNRTSVLRQSPIMSIGWRQRWERNVSADNRFKEKPTGTMVDIDEQCTWASFNQLQELVLAEYRDTHWGKAIEEQMERCLAASMSTGATRE
jgi:hypothetical protein